MENVAKLSSKAGAAANIWKMKIFMMLINSFSFGVPTIVLYLGENGVGLSQVFILEALFAIALATLEVPSGYLADVCGRKKTLILGGIFLSIGAFGYLIAGNFSEFLAAELTLAVGFSMTSGANCALVYDTLLELKDQESYSKHWGSILQWSLLMSGLAAIVGGVLGAIDLRAPYFLITGGMILSVFVALSFEEPKRHRAKTEKPLKEILSIVKLCFLENRKALWIILFSTLLVCCFQPAFWTYQPLMQAGGITIEWFGWIFALCSLTGAITSRNCHRIEKRWGLGGGALIMLVILALSFILQSVLPLAMSPIIFQLHQMVRGIWNVIFSDYLNREVGSSHRATALSLKSMVQRAGYAIALILISPLVKESPESIFPVLLVLLLGVGIPLLWKRPR